MRKDELASPIHIYSLLEDDGVLTEPIKEFPRDNRQCHKHLRSRAQHLLGQRIVPSMGNKKVVLIRLFVGDPPESPSMEFRAVNRIANKDVAFALLHFLAHLDGSCIQEVSLAIPAGPLLAQPPPHRHALNPTVLEQLASVDCRGGAERPFRLRALTLSTPLNFNTQSLVAK